MKHKLRLLTALIDALSVPTMKTHALNFLGSLLLPCLHTLSAADRPTLQVPDFTQGGAIPAGATHDWNLGATGARGWMFCDKLMTTAARQIRVTEVDENSPAAGVLNGVDLVSGKALAAGVRVKNTGNTRG